LPLRARPRLGSAGAGAVVAQRCLQGLVHRARKYVDGDHDIVVDLVSKSFSTGSTMM
jgi:hypothetical protein